MSEIDEAYRREMERMADRDVRLGLYRKLEVTRTDGRSAPGENHHECRYFVLDLDHDEYAYDALAAYADACEAAYPELAADLRRKVLTRSGSEGDTA